MVTAPNLDTMWSAFLARDPAVDGRFIVAVKTTGIYCRPICPARRPLRQNVEFFDTPLQASSAGYRACKRCRPDELTSESPLVGRLKRLAKTTSGRITESDLARLGVDPSTARRNFKRATGQTFAGWQRAAAKQIGDGNLSTITFPSPLGPIAAIAGDHALLMLNFVDSKYNAVQTEKLIKRFGGRIIERSNPVLLETHRQMDEYFAGTRQHFDLPLDPPELPFARQAWEALINIPYGQTRSYGQQAKFIDRPTACRAVARANATNLIAVILPCHRVVGSNGMLTGYAGGLHRKKWLLEYEQAVLRKTHE